MDNIISVEKTNAKFPEELGKRGLPAGDAACEGDSHDRYFASGAGVAFTSLSEAAAVVSESWFWMIWRQFGSTRRAETKIRRLRLLDHSLRLRKRRPTKGMSPRKGILSSIDLRSSVMRPPITMVEPL